MTSFAPSSPYSASPPTRIRQRIRDVHAVKFGGVGGGEREGGEGQADARIPFSLRPVSFSHSLLSPCPFPPAALFRPARARPLPTTLAPTPPSHRPSRESAFDRPEFFSTLESGALRAISRLVAGWSSPRKTPRKIVRSIYLRSSGPKRTTRRRKGRVRDEKDRDEGQGKREPTVLEGIEKERERQRDRRRGARERESERFIGRW